MLKFLHVTFVLLALVSFIGRVALAQFKPELLQQPWQKVVPHVISTLLLLSGIGLVFQGNWLSADHGWIVAKILALLGFIGLGILAIKRQGTERWQAFGGAMLCFVYIVAVAATKQIWPLG